MEYNPYSAVNAIYKLKGQWTDAKDADSKSSIAKKAQTYYNQLRSNDYGDVADELTASNYARAKEINDKWAKMGKTSARDYLYSLGQSRGMTNKDIDGLLKWDNQTGEVTFGGKKIGTPDATVNGVSYWSDTTPLDNAFYDYVSRSGNARTKSRAIDQENEKLFALYNREYEDLKATNPFTTDEAKSILQKYDLAGLRGRDNAVADNAGTNGGNIDSFAAANALRQQSALINQGQQAVLDAHKQKLEHARALLSDMGVNIDRVFNQEETAKNNEVTRNSQVAAVSGYTPAEWSIKNDAFLKNFVDDAGKLKPEYQSTDFQALINNAKANGDSELANKYAILRGLKIFGNFAEYGKYLNQGDVSYVKPQKTESARQFDEQTAASDRTLAAQMAMNSENNRYSASNGSKSGAKSTRETTKTQSKPTLTAAQATNAIKNGELSETVLDAYNYYYGTDYTIDNPPNVNTTQKAPMTEAEVSKWVKYLNQTVADQYKDKYADSFSDTEPKALKTVGKNQYAPADAGSDYIIIKVFQSDDLTQEQKEYLLYDKFGITEEQVDAAIHDRHYR